MISTSFTSERVMMSYSEVVTESSLRASISVGLRQLAKSLSQADGVSASGEISSLSAYEQVGNWLKNHATTYDGRTIDVSWFRHLLAEEMDNLRYLIGEQAYWAGNYQEAGRLFNEMVSRIVN